jgi:hypothetical protein
MDEFVTTLYFTVTRKDGSKNQYKCRGYEEKPNSYELSLVSGEHISLKKEEIESCVCTGFAPFWAA